MDGCASPYLISWINQSLFIPLTTRTSIRRRIIKSYCTQIKNTDHLIDFVHFPQIASLLVPCSVFNGYNVTNEYRWRTRDEKNNIRGAAKKGKVEKRRLINQTECPLIFCTLHFDKDLTNIWQEKFHTKKFEGHGSLNSFALTEQKFQNFTEQQRGKWAQRKTNV